VLDEVGQAGGHDLPGKQSTASSASESNQRNGAMRGKFRTQPPCWTCYHGWYATLNKEQHEDQRSAAAGYTRRPV
jgi:hypothetical protein